MTWSRRNFVKLLSGATAWGAIPSLSRGLAETPPVAGTMRVEGNRILVTTPDMSVELVGLGIKRIRNERTKRDYLVTEAPAHLVVTHTTRDGQAHTGFVTAAELVDVHQTSRTGVHISYKPLAAGLPGAQVKGVVSLSPGDGSLSFGADVKLDHPGLTAVLHPLRDLSNQNELLLPIMGGVRLTGRDHPRLFVDSSSKEAIIAKPGRMNKGYYPWPYVPSGCFLLYKIGEEGFWLRSEDTKLLYKLLGFEQTDQNIHLSFGTSVSGKTHECTQFSGARWKLQVFQNNWQQKLDQYVAYLKADSPAWKYHKNRIPWVDDIRLLVNDFKVVEVDKDGNAIDSPTLIAANLDLLTKLSKLIPPQRVVVYSFFWQLIRMEYGSGVGYPDWTPAPGYARMVTEARKMGYHIMPHLNFFAISPKNADYKKFAPFILRDPVTGKKLGWLFNEEKEEGMGYVHPAAPGWFEYQLRLVKEMLAAMPADAIFWDQTLNLLNAENDIVNGKTMIEGTMGFLRRFREALPNIAFGGEGVTEITVPYQDFVQAHNPGVCFIPNPDNPSDVKPGLNTETIPNWEPVVSRLYGDCVRLVGYVAEPDTQASTFADWLRLTKRYGLVTSITGLSMKDLDDPDGLVVRAIRDAQ